MTNLGVRRRRSVWLLAIAVCLLGSVPDAWAQTDVSGTSSLTTWTCTGSPCPWGASLSAHALAWPASVGPLDHRLTYTTSNAVYLSSDYANGAIIWINSGSAILFAGTINAKTHRQLATVNAGGYYAVSGLAPGEVLSVQGLSQFTYQILLPEPVPGPEVPQDPAATSSSVSWVCTGSPCPWGSSISAHALAWPATANPIGTRLGYTTSKPVYLPSGYANGAVIWINSGSATLFAGSINASTHRTLATVSAGGYYVVTGLGTSEVLSVQSGAPFQYQIALADPPPEPEVPPADPGSLSQNTSWNCTGSPCPWGASLSVHALAWPASAEPLDHRLGYTTSRPVYLSSGYANGAVIWIDSGTATLFAGGINASSHRTLTTIGAGGSYEVSGLSPGEVLSVQSLSQFQFRIALAEPPPPPEIPEDAIPSVFATWRCNIPECSGPDWQGAVIDWPSWSAYSSNGRSGNQSRTAYRTESLSGPAELLYPYMGAWADGCTVTVATGAALIIEWTRGTNRWRETYLYPGESHTIDLLPGEDGALIETFQAPDGYWSNFSVTLDNCDPQPLP